MRYDTLTPREKLELKDKIVGDYVRHGMTEEEALVNYVHCVNRDPVKWMGYKYGMAAEKAASLRESGLRAYEKNGGTFPYAHVEPPGPVRTCRCSPKVIVPQ